MGKFLNKFKGVAEKTDEVINNNKIEQRPKQGNYNKHIKYKENNKISDGMFDGVDDEFDEWDDVGIDGGYGFNDNFGVGIQIPQKPESFFHYILENKYTDLEKSIRGYKDVYNKDTREWEVVRKKIHCFTDDEAEEILRMAQSLLSTDIKLGFINKDFFGYKAMSLYKRVKQLFREIAEYRYGRYSHTPDGKPIEGGYSIEQEMKLQNLKIFVELSERIIANYSRSIQGTENRETHNSVKGQESLQSTEKLSDKNRRYS